MIEMTTISGAGAAKPEPKNENEESKIEITADAQPVIEDFPFVMTRERVDFSRFLASSLPNPSKVK